MKQIYDKQWNKLTEAVIENDAQPLCIVDSAYFHITERSQLSEVIGQADETAFVGMADQEDLGVEEMKGQEEEEQDEQD